MTRRSIYSGSKFEEIAGYARAVVDGEWVLVSGTAGYDPATMRFPDGAAAQARQALKTIGEALAEADATLEDVVQVRVYLAAREHVMPVSEILGATFRDPRPTNTTIICGFPAEEILVEIEVAALRRRS
ncbi:RidA family protein [Aureimonas ureilytica]|uniref:RidA family protein n=1 Tax=Aureimonas ureilytica TaxID=401562 RepID=UPI00037CBD1A|nr:RidA family protein [Aureimonas ureilytica]